MIKLSRKTIKDFIWEQHRGMETNTLESEIEMILWWERTREEALQYELEKQIKDKIVWYLSGDKKEH